MTASLNGFGTWPKDNDELIILRSGSSATGDNTFCNLVGTGSNRHVVGLDAVISLFSSSRPIVVKHCSFSLGAMNEAEVLDAVEPTFATWSHRIPCNDHGPLTPNLWWHHGIAENSVMGSQKWYQCKSVTGISRGPHTDPLVQHQRCLNWRVWTT